jgi:hypothetical protein
MLWSKPDVRLRMMAPSFAAVAGHPGDQVA